MIVGAARVFVKKSVRLYALTRRPMITSVSKSLSYGPSTSCSRSIHSGSLKPKYVSSALNSSPCHSNIVLKVPQRSGFSSCVNGEGNKLSYLIIKTVAPKGSWTRCGDTLSVCRNVSVRVLRKITYGTGPSSFWPRGIASTTLAGGMLVFLSNSEPVKAEASRDDEKNVDHSSEVNISLSKKVHSNYSVICVPGDGRCLFRSVVHGACLHSGKPAPSESLQTELADELRARVADELIKRREETEWFIEGDFDSYVCQMRKPHVWGGEPELLMASHVLQKPITVYMFDEDSGGLIAIAEYGEEYGKQDPIHVLYHGIGHYDALQFVENGVGKSRL